ncbi:MAG: helix-turn-helix transcriptional regulator [Lachnospiraceae bacterium]|nr:helix-turn-helix transcriptional regulator [Lachnospiraceae bacterium]
MNEQQMKTVICRNLKILFDSRPGSRAAFARRYYMSQSTVTKWTQGIIGDISLCNAWRVAAYFSVSLDWLVTDHSAVYAYEYADTEQ